MTEGEKTDALKVTSSIIMRCEKLAPKFAPGTPQHTLLKNRIQALKIGAALLDKSNAAQYSDEALSAAPEPLASILQKCEKARSKYAPNSGQYHRYDGTIQAAKLCLAMIENELHRRVL